MSRDLIELILPRLARRLNRQLRRYRSGRLDDKQFSLRFEELVQQQHAWLANKGYSELDSGELHVLADTGKDSEAMFEIGHRLETGTGAAKNLPLAIHWYERAAGRGQACAAFNLGLLQAEGVVFRDARTRSIC